MKTVIHYFSATGNTARAVGILAEQLAAAGHEVVRHVIDGRAAPPPEVPVLTVVAFPILSWAAPHFVLDYARRLPKAAGARAAVLATCGGFGAQGVPEMARRLRRRGYRVAGSGEARYPDNWTLAQRPPAGDKLAQALANGDAATMQFANSILSPEPAMYRCAFGHRLWSRPIARLFRVFGRRFLGKMFIADGRCTSCGRCAATCPVRAIRMEGVPARPRWSAGCAACYRCINLCPVQAVQISVPLMVLHLGLNLALAVGWFFWVGWLYRQVVPLPGAAGFGLAAVWAVAIFAVLTWLQLTAVDALLHALATRTPWRGFFRKNYTHAFGRHRAPGFNPGA